VRNSDVRRKASLRTAADSTRAWEETLCVGGLATQRGVQSLNG